MRETLNLRQLATMTKHTIERLQNLKLRATTTHMLPYTKFYKQLFKEYKTDPENIHTIEDWQRLPLLKKATYMKKPQDFVVRPETKQLFTEHLEYLLAQEELPYAAELLFTAKKSLHEYYSPKMIIYSGGTESGMPTPVVITAQQKMNNLMHILKIIGELLLKKLGEQRTTGMNLFPYAPHLGWHAVHHALDLNADLNLCTAAGGAMSTERLVLMADKLKPNIICGMNSYLRNRFLPMMIEKKAKLPEKAVFINGAQKMNETEREQIKQLARKLGAKDSIVLDMYGASELKEALLPECTEGSGFHHLAPLSTIIKTVKVNGTNKEMITDWEFSETGYATSWNIDGAGTLLEGYIIGDHIARKEWDTCPHCGLNTLRIYDVNRIREVEAQLQLTGMVEEKVKGTRVNLSAIRQDIMRIPEVDEVQIIVKKGKKDELMVNYVTQKPATARKKITEYFKKQEVKPKLKQVTLKQLYADKMKLEGIIVR